MSTAKLERSQSECDKLTQRSALYLEAISSLNRIVAEEPQLQTETNAVVDEGGVNCALETADDVTRLCSSLSSSIAKLRSVVT